MSSPDRFDRLSQTPADTADSDRLTRQSVLEWWDDRFGVNPDIFATHGFWERGAGKIWAVKADIDLASPVSIQALGMHMLRTRQEHWKPTLEAAQRFGHHASRNVIHLEDSEAQAFVAGDDLEIDWEGDWGYLLVTHDIARGPEMIGVGLYTHGELRSQVPKGRRREF